MAGATAVVLVDVKELVVLEERHSAKISQDVISRLSGLDRRQNRRPLGVPPCCLARLRVTFALEDETVVLERHWNFQQAP